MMSKRFNLQALERFREQKEKESLKVMAKAQQVLQEEKSKKRKLMEAMGTSISRREALSQEVVHPGQYLLEESFIKGSKQRILESENFIRKLEVILERSRQHYLNLRKERMMITKLRERFEEEIRREKKKRENKLQDDLYTTRFRFRKRVA